MPRVAQVPRTNSGSRAPSRSASGTVPQSPFKNSPMKIPLNDDAQEKVQRLQSRHALHDVQLNQLKAAATPTSRKGAALRLNDLDSASPGSVASSPHTPRGGAGRSSHGGGGSGSAGGARRGRASLGGGGSGGAREAIARAALRRRNGEGGGGDGNNNNDDDDDMVVGGAAVTPMKRVPILANFEEWMKMATDNKINATNSWNFALIDYFHDMSLLKEGDGVNFQKASCTLDGCVKIYTSRVDSVATETGRLLSGLADSREKKRAGGGGGGGGDGDAENDDDDDDEDDELDADGNRKKKPKKKTRSEATLAPSFASLQAKKLELEFAVDPLFKKASADFDEGGAKGLLLNHLMIDGQGRIVFDSSDDANDVARPQKKKKKTRKGGDDDGEEGEGDEENDDDDDDDEAEGTTVLSTGDAAVAADEGDQDVPIDVVSLGHRFFPELHRLDELDVCPSLKTFDLGNPSGSLDIPFLRAPEEARDGAADGDDAGGNKTGLFIDEDNPLGLDDLDGLGGFDLGGDVDFGEGGEAWAREARLDPHLRVYDAGLDGDGIRDDLLLLDGEGGGGGGGGGLSGGGLAGPGGGSGAGPGGDADDFTIAMAHAAQPNADRLHENMLSYFDQALRKNWTSAEHWRIRKIKTAGSGGAGAAGGSAGATGRAARKEKEPFSIDFAAPLDDTLAELLFTQASSNTAILLPRKDWKAKTRNLLPDDKHFHSKQLLSLFLKPKARLSRRRQQQLQGFGFSGGGGGGGIGGIGGASTEAPPPGGMDEAFWAAQNGPVRASVENNDGDGAVHGDYDADFFADDGLPFAGGGGGGDGDDDDDGDLDEFADAREHFSPADGAVGGVGGVGGGGGGGDDGDGGGLTQGFTQGLGFTTTGFGGFGGFGGLTVTNPADLAFGTTLVTSSRRVRPEYVQYARVAKRVDVRRLKEELWKGMAFGTKAPEPEKEAAAAAAAAEADVSRLLTPPPGEADAAASIDGQLARAAAADGADRTLRFTDVMNGLQRVYPKAAMDDISTSYCFISLLHLANEEGLVINKTEGLTDLMIRKDWTAEVGE